MTEGDKWYAKDKTEKGNAVVRECNLKFDGSGDGVSSISLSGDTVLKRAEASHIYDERPFQTYIFQNLKVWKEKDAEHTEEEKVRKFSIKSKILNNQVCKRGRKQNLSLSLFMGEHTGSLFI